MSTETGDKVKNENNFEMSVETGDFKVSDWGIRHQQCIILFFCLTIAYSMRSCMGVALVAMIDSTILKDATSVNGTNLTIINGTATIDATEDYESDGILGAILLIPPYPKFKWKKKVQDAVIASFFWGYMLLQIPAGQLAHRFGSRYLLFGALSVNCFISFCIPWAAYYGGWVFTVICRVTQGLTQACVIPSMHTFFGRWVPLTERGRLAAFAYGGQALGTVMGLPITGFVAASPLGWPGIFRFYGLLSGVMATILWFMISDTPAQHPKISPAERQYIEDGLGYRGGNRKKLHPVPWAKILTCRGMYAIIFAHIANTWGQVTLYSEVPAYMNKVMGVDIKANGLLTALPFLVMWFTNFFFSWFTDMLIERKIFSVTNTRKLANSIGCIPAAIGLVTLGFVPKNIYIIETILIIVCALKISSHVGFHINHIDISTNFSGTMISISNFVSNLVGSLAPIVAGVILTDVTSELLWRQVFFVAAGFYFFTNLAYVILGTGERAEWDYLPEDEETPEADPMLEKKETET